MGLRLIFNKKTMSREFKKHYSAVAPHIKKHIEKTKTEIQECGTPIDELGNFPTTAQMYDYSFMDELDDYLISRKVRCVGGGHYIQIKIDKGNGIVIEKTITAKTFEELMKKTRAWCEENNKGK